MKKLFALILFATTLQNSFAQCPVANFNLPDTACAGASLPLVNTSTGNGLTYEWDFCPREIQGPHTFSSHGTNGFLFNGLGDFKLIEANGGYYIMSFDTFISTQAFLRCDIGTDLYTQTPNANYYFLTPFNKADHFDFIEDNGTWYGLACYSPTNTLFLMTFGAGITAQPTTSAITGITSTDVPTGIRLVKSNGNYFGLITNKGNNSLTCIGFGNSMANAPTQLYSYIVPGAAGLSDVDVDLTCSPIYGFVSNDNSGNIIRLNFGNDISVAPTASTVGAYGTAGNRAIALAQERNFYYLFFTDKTNNKLRHLAFENSYTATPAVFDYTNFFNVIKDVQYLKDNSKVRLVADDFVSNSFSEVIFSDSCGGNNASQLQNPVYSYTSTGWHYLTLTVTDSLGFTSVKYDSIYLVPGPTSNFSFAGNLCYNSGDSISFTDLSSSPSGSITAWNWDFDDGSFSSQQNPFHTFPAAGTYNVKLTITAGCDKDTVIPITIKETPAVGFTYLQQCSGIPTPFTDTTLLTSTSILSWLWNFGDSTPTSSSQNPVHAYANGGSYNVSLVVTSSQGCTDSVLLPVLVDYAPQIAFTVLNTCVGDTVLFQNQTTIGNGAAITYDWNFGDGSPNTSVVSPSHPYASANTYPVTLIATSGLCSDTLVQPVTITSPPTPAFSFPPINCQFNPVQFTDSSVGVNISSWIWDFGDGDSAFVQNPIHVFSGNGPFTVTLTVSAGNNCTATLSQQIQVTQSPNAAFTSNNVCLGLPVSFTDISTLGPVTNWVWSFGDGDSSFTQNTLHTYATAGMYNAVLQVTNALGCSDTALQQVTVFNLPVAGFQTSPFLCSGTPITFYDTSVVLNDVISNWHWDFGDGGIDSIQDPDHTFATGGIKTITLIVNSTNGCGASVQQNITVNQSPQFNFTATNFCLGDTTKFTYNVTGVASAFSWLWNFGDGGGAFTAHAKHVYAIPGAYAVSLFVVDSNGCNATDIDTILINAKPNASFMSSGICEQASVTFNNSTSPTGIVSSWLWNFGDLQTSTDSFPTHVYADSGNYHVTLIAYAIGGCNDTASANIIIKPKPVINFSSLPSTGAINVPLQFTNNSTGASVYIWNFGDNSSPSNQPNPSHAYADTGSFAVTLIGVSSFGCRDTIIKYIDVLVPYIDLIMENITYTVDDNLLNLNSKITNAGNTPAVTYILETTVESKGTYRETSFDTIKPSNSLTYLLNTKFKVSNDAFPSYACIEIKKVNSGLDAILTNNTKCIPLTSDFTIATVNPNPAANQIVLSYTLPQSGDVKIVVYDSRGRLVDELFNQYMEKGYSSNAFNISHLAKGVYYIKIILNDDAKQVRFFKM